MMKAVLNSARKVYSQEVLPRILIDLLLAHIAAVVALGMPVLYEAIVGDGATAVANARDARAYYANVFVPLSVIFPVAFLLNGFYRKTNGFQARYKPKIVLRAVASSAVLFAVGSYLLSPPEIRVPRSDIVLCAVILAAAAGVRIAKAIVVRYAGTEAQTAEAPQPAELVLVVGGAGYIGSMLVRRLLDGGHRVRVLDSLIYGDEAIRDLLQNPRLDLRVGDCRNMTTVIDAVHGVDAIVHLAAIVGDPACDLDHTTTNEINYGATRMLIEVAKGHKIARFVFASTCSVYGATDEFVDETSRTYPLSVYARTKLASEKALLEACDETFHPAIVRLATVFGNSPRPRFDLVVNLLTGKAYTERVITIYNGEQWRPFIHVADVARGLEHILNAPLNTVGGHIFNLGDSRLNYTLADVAARIRSAIPDTEVSHVDNSDRRNYRVCFDKVRTQLGFECMFDLDYGIRELKNAFEQGRITDYRDVHYNNCRYLQVQGSPIVRKPMDAKVMAAFASAAQAVEA